MKSTCLRCVACKKRAGKCAANVGYDARANGNGYAPRRHSAAPRARSAAERSRSLYLGSVPDDMSLAEVAAAVEPYGVVESLRMVRRTGAAASEHTWSLH